MYLSVFRLEEIETLLCMCVSTYDSMLILSTFSYRPEKNLCGAFISPGKLTRAVFLNNLLRRHAYYRIFSRVVKKKKERKRGGRKRKKVLLPAYGVFVKKPAEHWFLNFTRIKHSHCSFRVEKNLCWRNEREKKR